jgi:hypothetical protein
MHEKAVKDEEVEKDQKEKIGRSESWVGRVTPLIFLTVSWPHGRNNKTERKPKFERFKKYKMKSENQSRERETESETI